MTTTTITLERSAYERLRAHKKPKESFSQAVLRILDPERPTLRRFWQVLSAEDAAAVGGVVDQMRTEERAAEKARSRNGGSRRGHSS